MKSVCLLHEVTDRHDVIKVVKNWTGRATFAETLFGVEGICVPLTCADDELGVAVECLYNCNHLIRDAEGVLKDLIGSIPCGTLG